MEKRRNFLRHTVSSTTLLPVEQEMLDSVCEKIEAKLEAPISRKTRTASEVLYDRYDLTCGKDSYVLKVNLSPDTPNFWRELRENHFSFHPEIVASSFDDDFTFYCYKTTKTFSASSLTEFLLSKRLGLQHKIAEVLNETHAIKLSDVDQTTEVFRSMLPIEAGASVSSFPLAHLFPQCKQIFAKLYKPTTDLGLCHFDVSPRNLLYNNSDFKLINFEYAANANVYINTLLVKETLNGSDESFNDLLSDMTIDKTKLVKYLDAAEIFTFCYFNSKILAEYLTFGTRNEQLLRYWVQKSEAIYKNIKQKFFLQKPIDKSIDAFYDAWRQ